MESSRRKVRVWITPGAGEWGAQSPESNAFLTTAATRAELEAKLPASLEAHFGEPVDFVDIGPTP